MYLFSQSRHQKSITKYQQTEAGIWHMLQQ